MSKEIYEIRPEYRKLFEGSKAECFEGTQKEFMELTSMLPSNVLQLVGFPLSIDIEMPEPELKELVTDGKEVYLQDVEPNTDWVNNGGWSITPSVDGEEAFIRMNLPEDAAKVTYSQTFTGETGLVTEIVEVFTRKGMIQLVSNWVDNTPELFDAIKTCLDDNDIIDSFKDSIETKKL